jgi:CHASE2 domain-containing sensor protein
MFVAVFLERRAFLVFGAMGVFGYLGHLSYSIFKDSMLFPLALTFIGLLVIFLGVTYQRKRVAIESFVLSLAPNAIRRLRPIER